MVKTKTAAASNKPRRPRQPRSGGPPASHSAVVLGAVLDAIARAGRNGLAVAARFVGNEDSLATVIEYVDGLPDSHAALKGECRSIVAAAARPPDEEVAVEATRASKKPRTGTAELAVGDTVSAEARRFGDEFAEHAFEAGDATGDNWQTARVFGEFIERGRNENGLFLWSGREKAWLPLAAVHFESSAAGGARHTEAPRAEAPEARTGLLHSVISAISKTPPNGAAVAGRFVENKASVRVILDWVDGLPSNEYYVLKEAVTRVVAPVGPGATRDWGPPC